MKILKTLIPRILIPVLGILLLVQIGITVQAKFAKSAAITSTWSWAYRPETLKEMYELSDMIVIGTVTDIKEGPQWVGETTSIEHPTETADSMLISVSVLNPIKGKVNIGDQITIYRLVNIEQNTHEIGETYLLFLRARLESTDSTDGSHFLFAAESNYHIVEDRLIWDWSDLANNKNSFAANELDNVQLDTVLQQVDSLKDE